MLCLLTVIARLRRGFVSYGVSCQPVHHDKLTLASRNSITIAINVTEAHKEHMPAEHARNLFKRVQIQGHQGSTDAKATEDYELGIKWYGEGLDRVGLTVEALVGRVPRQDDLDRLVYCLWR